MDELIMSAYNRRDNKAQSIEDFCAGLIQNEMARAAQLEAERDAARRALAQYQQTRAELIETVDALRRENEEQVEQLRMAHNTLDCIREWSRVEVPPENWQSLFVSWVNMILSDKQAQQ